MHITKNLKCRFRGIALTAMGSLMVTAATASPQVQVPQGSSESWRERHEQKVAEAKQGAHDVVLIGDSITHYAERDSLYGYYFGNRKTLNLGFGGDGTERVLWRLQNGELDGVEPKLVALMIGTNDARNQSPEAIVAGIGAILDALKVRTPEAEVILFSVFPRKAGKEQNTLDRVNQLLTQFDAREKVTLVDIRPKFYLANGELNPELYHRDMLHLITKGYQIWWDALEPYLSKALNEEPLPANPPMAVLSGTRDGPRHQQKLEEVKRGDYELVFVGDSITHFWEREGEFGMPVWEKYYGHRKAFNLGFGGDRTEFVNWRLQNGEIDGLDPKLVVLMIGTNNTHIGKYSPDETIAGISSNIHNIRRRLPNAKVLLLSIFPRGENAADPLRRINEQINARLPELAAADPAITHLNINQAFLEADGTLSSEVMPDLLHPNTKGYAIWAEAMEPTLSKLLNDEPVQP
ncbi:GDSL-type esterase/lipase family protein [Rubritalea marina]|uniref:GDSL-type esterase/lipase family protein n=1 Tax=Rubritalea marina TaxID=361055 RepID=UPI00037E5FFB|nr:GDSL-type esterase/lipase family protein [Rubritalea marina]